MNRFQVPLSISLHLMFLFVEWSVLNNQLAVADLLSSFQSSLTEPDPGLQLVIIHSISTEQEEKVLLVPLASFTLNIPVILPGHLVLVLSLVLVIHTLCHIFIPLSKGLISG